MKYIVFYSDKKNEDVIMIKNMFENCIKIDINWTDIDYNNDIKIISDNLEDSEINNVIFLGLELGWDKLIQYIRKKYSNIKIKVINNTSEALLYYDYERNNFFRLLELSKENEIDSIAFLKHGQYQLYKSLGYKCYYLMQNYILHKEKKMRKDGEETINIGIFPLNYTWDKNIFNQLCIGKFVQNSTVFFNNLDNRMAEFVDTMNINNNALFIKDCNEDSIIEKMNNITVSVSCNFTDYFNPIFFISMELGIPCLIGDTSDLFENNEKLKYYIVTQAEDNAIENARLIEKIIDNKNNIMNLYEIWKKKYNIQSKLNIQKFIEE